MQAKEIFLQAIEVADPAERVVVSSTRVRLETARDTTAASGDSAKLSRFFGRRFRLLGRPDCAVGKTDAWVGRGTVAHLSLPCVDDCQLVSCRHVSQMDRSRLDLVARKRCVLGQRFTSVVSIVLGNYRPEDMGLTRSLSFPVRDVASATPTCVRQSLACEQLRG
jgi:hypothetical protein